VNAKKSSQKLGSYKKLENIYCRPSEINTIDLVAYELSLPSTIKAHNIFHVSLLKRYVDDPIHIIYWALI